MKSIPEMGQLRRTLFWEVYRNDVEAQFLLKTVQFLVKACGHRHQVDFDLVNGCLRLPVAQRTTAFHLHGNEVITLQGQDVDLRLVPPKVPGQDAAPDGLEVVESHFFAADTDVISRTG